MDGILIVDKPCGWTSHDVVNKVRRLAGTKKVGHLGTLDPSATGVLPLVVGKATRLAQFYTRNDKIYEGVIHFGYATDTYDAEGTPAGEVRDIAVPRDQLDQALDQFRGKFEQVPPPISAKKIGGVPAYKLARKNQPVELKPVAVEVYSLEILTVDGAEAAVRIHCSSGTYVRSIAHGAGQVLGCGAMLKSLRRIASGCFPLDRAHTLEELEALSREGRVAEAVIPAADLLPEFPTEVVDPVTIGHIRNGRTFRVSPFTVCKDARYVKAVDGSGQLVAIGEARLPHVYHPVLVL